MPVSDQALLNYYQEFQDEAGEEFATERVEKKQDLPELLTEETIQQFEEGDVRALIRNLWAYRGWSNKDYIVNQVLEDGIEHVRETFYEALYETETIEEKFDTLNELHRLGPASITEILTFMYPEQCAIYNRRAQAALDVLSYSEEVEAVETGEEYETFLTVVEMVMDRLEQLEATGTQPAEIQDYVDVDYFLFYLSTLDIEEPGAAPKEPDPIEDFDHDEMQEKLLEIGDGLGFDVEDEYQAGPGAQIDVRWSTRVANLGVISYAFEVHRRGSRDSAILNLQKAQNADPTLQKLVIVSTHDKLDRFRNEIGAISADFGKSIAYLDIGQVETAVDLLADLKEVLQDAGLMGDL